MPQVSAPGPVPGRVSTNDLSGSGKSLLMGVAGVGLAVVVIKYGLMAGNRMTAVTDGLLGTNASGQSDEITFDGSP